MKKRDGTDNVLHIVLQLQQFLELQGRRVIIFLTDVSFMLMFVLCR